MLGKLLKYDIRSTWRDFIAVYASIILGVLILPQLFANVHNEVVTTIAGFIAVGIIVATIVVMVAMLFKIYNTNVYSKEGYLTLTLPVSAAQVVTSKLIVSSMWIVLTGIVLAIGLIIFLSSMSMISLPELYATIKMIISMIEDSGSLAIILFVLGTILSTVKDIAKLFLACSIAHLKQLNRFRIPAGILSYFVFSWIEVLIVQAFVFIGSMFLNKSEFIMQLEQMNEINSPELIVQHMDIINLVLGVGILYNFIWIAAFAIGTIWLLNRKLDLD